MILPFKRSCGNTRSATCLKVFLRLFQSLIICFTLSSPAFCWDTPFDNGANWGGTGLMEIPTARILGDGVVRAGAAQALPYRWFTIDMGIFPGLEAGGRLTEMTNVSTRLGSDYGAYKDKAFDIKYQILPESRYSPAIALGLHDFHGTRLFRGQYLVMSRQIFPFDFTLGFGKDRLGGGPEVPSFFDAFDDVGIFGGIEWALNERINVMAEYNPIEYEKGSGAPARAVPEGADLPVNIGLRYKLIPGVQLGASYQRGDTLGLYCHVQSLLGASIVPKRPDPPLQYPVDRRPFEKRDMGKMLGRMSDALNEAGFKGVCVYTGGREITAEITNARYLSNQKAVGRALRILLFYSPNDAKMLSVIVKRRKMRLLSVSVEPELLEKYLFGKIPEYIFQKALKVTSVSADENKKDDLITEVKEDDRLDFSWGIKPDFKPYLNDPSGFFKGRAGIKPHARVEPWQGGAFHGRYDIPFYSNISSSNPLIPNAVRSDSWLYSDRDYTFERLLFDQSVCLSKGMFGRISAGYLENMYAGVGGEVLKFFNRGNLALGVESDWVRKREPGSQLSLLDQENHTIIGNAYYRVAPFDVTLQGQYGRFLAGDKGFLFTASREYSTGAILGAWYSLTDTDHLSSFNRDYNDKGIFLSLPMRMFLKTDSGSRYTYAISPWTRDVAALPVHWSNIYGLASDLMPAVFREDLNDMKK